MADALKETPLHAAHVELGAKMVPFGGWHMPIQYPAGILAEHRAVRESVGIFDVSHMGEIDFTGAGALATVQRLVTNDIGKLVIGRAAYTVVCHDNGGIVDDCIVYRVGPEHYRIVVNASNIAKDHDHFRRHASAGPEGRVEACTIVDRSAEFALIAVQGPKAPALVAKLAGGHLCDVPTFGFAEGNVDGVPITAARTGYTGEDGFELFVTADRARPVWDAFVQAGAAPIGLGARDTLRLEARLCLYGNDIDDTTDPYGAQLGWVVKLDKGAPCLGHDALSRIKAAGPAQKLVGWKLVERGICRDGAEVVDDAGAVIGRVTSGGVSPTMGGSIGMAYVPAALATPGQRITLRQRGKTFAAELVKGPFYRRTT